MLNALKFPSLVTCGACHDEAALGITAIMTTMANAMDLQIGSGTAVIKFAYLWNGDTVMAISTYMPS
jgi:hypothetical protein